MQWFNVSNNWYYFPFRNTLSME
ncbi:MAG: hypothetical protein GX638_10110 [Crenarchaeota archaeon]|nr:hypothetical protein [Thermoproteota archaeon]